MFIKVNGMGQTSSFDGGGKDAHGNVSVKLFGGNVGDPDSAIALYEFQCSTPEIHDASTRLRSQLIPRLKALSASGTQLPIAIENAWVGAMLAVAKSLTVRVRTPDKFDDGHKDVVRDGLCATIEEAGEALQEDDRIEVYISLDTDLTVCIHRGNAPVARMVELGNINHIAARIGALGNQDQPTVH